MSDSDGPDLKVRDPNNINPHIECYFEDVLAEPDNSHSIDCVWKLSYTCFNLWKGVCYKIATLLCGICVATKLGSEFAMISFYHIWFFTPMFKVCDINCGCMKKCWTQCVSCYLEPVCTACGMLFHNFKK